MWSMNLGKAVNIPKLNEASAIELGAELVGEAVIFTIASGILIFEYVRQTRKEAAKEAAAHGQMELILNDLKELYTKNARQDAQINELIRILEEKIPDSRFAPIAYNASQIPEHHREDVSGQHEESIGVYSTMKGWVFNAIDFVLPPVSNTPPQNHSNIVVIPQNPSTSASSDSCKCADSSSGSSSNLPAITSSKTLDNNTSTSKR